MKIEKKESIVDSRLTQIEANEDWTEAHTSDPILRKIIKLRKRTNDLPEMRHQQKILLQKHIGRYRAV